MCGIVGQLLLETKIDANAFNQMRDTLTHRGPDGYGSQFLENGHVALGHRRLSIIDLSEKGKQPMTNEEGRIWVTFNGEIYNYKTLRAELLSMGHTFSSHSDTEVLIHGYEAWGIEGLLERIKGMFAFGLYDGNSKDLFLARDRFGIKPLFYYRSQEKKELIFASELKAILKAPDFTKELNVEALEDYLIYRFIPSPKSIWKYVYKLEPAHYLKYNLHTQSVVTQKYWSLNFNPANKVTFEEAKAYTEYLLQQSMKEHLESDVPVGVFLSGGYDSGTVIVYMNALNYSPHSYSIGFKGWKSSEHVYARLVADQYKSQHTEKVLEERLVTDMEDLMYYYDEPIGGSSFLPTYQVSRLAAEQVKVVMAGDGGDEVFGGYKWYYQILDKIAGQGLIHKLKNQLKGYGINQMALDEYFRKMSWAGYTYSDTAKLLRNSNHGSKKENDLYQSYFNGKSVLKSLQATDFSTFMPEVILNKVDRASMACSLEVRVPFLDHELVEYVYSLPVDHYYRKGINKHLLREIIKDKLPEAILNKPKSGFGAPVNRQNDILELYRRTLPNGALKESGIFDMPYINELLNNGDVTKLWPLYILELWFKKWY